MESRGGAQQSPFHQNCGSVSSLDVYKRQVYIPKDEGAGLVERLRSGEHSRNLYRQLGQYGVSIYEQHFNALDQAGDLERLEDGSVILSNLDLYSEHTGLSLEADDAKGLFI